jgi:hypothetical protein
MDVKLLRAEAVHRRAVCITDERRTQDIAIEGV